MTVRQVPQLGTDAGAPFPPTRSALHYPNGLLAWGGGLEPQRLLTAYRQGIFPWFSAGEPILWWSPAPRCVLNPADVHVSRRLRRRIRTGVFSLSADTAFDAVISACAVRGAKPKNEPPGTWITPGMQTSFIELHRLGHAHSVEVWQDGALAGGIYGLALGHIFFGESMFCQVTDASKVALVALCRYLQQAAFTLLDCQVPNPHLLSMGAISLSRAEFERRLNAGVSAPLEAGSWTNRFAAGSAMARDIASPPEHA